jgi:hypothetical protein
VEVLRHSAGFTQVRFEETDRYVDPQFASYTITGWVPNETLTNRRIRHFYLFDALIPTPDHWLVSVDYTVFDLFWASLKKLPPIIPPQIGWLRWLAAYGK